jgi:hypothetical protein
LDKSCANISGMGENLELFEQYENVEGAKKRILSYMPTHFVFCSLPLKNPKEDVREYEKRYNKYRMRIEGGKGIPGGKYARLLLTLFATEAVVRKSEDPNEKVILKYDSVKQLINRLGVGRAPYEKDITELLKRFAYSHIYFEITERKEYIKSEFKIAQDSDIPERGTIKLESVINVPFFLAYNRVEYKEKEHENGKSKKIVIILSPSFTEMVRNHSVPVDYDIYKEISRPLGKDLYVWLTYRNNGPIPAEGIHITRKKLMEQFYNDINGYERQYYAILIDEIKEIKNKYYPELKVTFKEDYNGIILYKSERKIKPKDVRYVPLINNGL